MVHYKVGKQIGIYGILFRPFSKFIYHYIRSGAILKGVEGLIYSLALLELEFSKSIMLWEFNNQCVRNQAIQKNHAIRSKFLEQLNSRGSS